MRRFLHTHTIIAAIAVIVLASCEGRESFVLRYTMPTGTTLTYEQTIDRVIKVIQNDSVTLERKEHHRVQFTQLCVLDSRDSLYQITQQEYWYGAKKDSSAGDTVLWEQTILMTLEPNGRLVNLTPGNEEEKSAASYLKSMLEQGTPVFPSERLRLGSRWSQSTQVIFPDDTLEASTSFLVDSIGMSGTHRCAIIAYNGNLILPMEVNPRDTLQRSGIDFVTSKGEGWYAIDGGYPVKSVEHWTIKGDRKKIIKGESIPYRVEVESDVVVTLIDVSSPSLAHK